MCMCVSVCVLRLNILFFQIPPSTNPVRATVLSDKWAYISIWTLSQARPGHFLVLLLNIIAANCIDESQHICKKKFLRFFLFFVVYKLIVKNATFRMLRVVLIYCWTSQMNREQFRCCIALVTSERCRNTRILWLLFVWNDNPRL